MDDKKKQEIDTTNRHMVTVKGNQVLITYGLQLMTSMEAKAFAAWLVAMADCVSEPDEPSFEDVLAAVQNC